jgi:ABC-type transport system involved in cytochrome c biogenesis permease subunit
MKKIILPILATVTVVVLAVGTVVEKFHGNEYACDHIYGSWWFCLLLALTGVYSLWRIVADKMWLRPYLLLLHSAVVVLLLGGALTAWTGRHGSVVLHPQTAANSYTTDDGKHVDLPFAITLDSFEVVSYAGTHTPMDFVSHLHVDGEAVTVSMNNILRREGFRFYQEDYDDEGNSTLSVAHDPWGIGVTYAGYLLLLAGVVALFADPRSRFRQLLKGAAVLVLLLAPALSQAAETPSTLPRATADKMGRMYVLYKGRVCPLQTLAKDFTTKLCGNARYKGLSAEQVLSGWIFYFNEWQAEPMIKVKGDDVRQLLGIEGRYASFNDLMAHSDAFQSKSMPAMMGGGAAEMPQGKVQSKNMRAAGEKKSLVQMLVGGSLMKIFPVADPTGQVGWYSQSDDLPMTVADDEYFFIRKQLSYCQELVVAGNFEELERVFEKTSQYQQQRAASVLPSDLQYGAERLYNRLTTGKWLYMLVITLGLVCFALVLFGVRQVAFPFVCCLLLTLFLLLIFVLRWIVGGHIPMAGGFDSMNLTAIVLGLVALLLTRRYRPAPAIGLLAMGFCLLVAMMSGSNPPVTHLMPVLSSPLLTLHVTVIMISYALFFFVMLNGVAALIVPQRAVAMRRVSLLMLYPAVTLLAAGIVIGALWANISWGNYWSWDPKEVWALITLIVYLYPLLQMQEDNRVRGFHLYCTLAFFSVIVTYFGVNFLLGGIHAYN